MFGQTLKARAFFLTTIGCVGLIPVATPVSGDVIKIGLRAHQGAERAIERWQPTADYLSATIPQHEFVLLPFEINSLLNQAVSRNEFDFVFTNPASYVEQKMRYGVSAIATLINKREGKAYSQFGSAIVTRADRNDISSFHDLKGKRFMGVDEQGFGGWRMAYRELLGKGVDPYEDFQLLSFGGGIQQNVVFAVRDGSVDAGSVRTGMLERMTQRGEIQLGMFKVLEPKKTEGFEFYHSSRLYPEWPFAKMAHTSDELADEVAAALYKLSPEIEAAKLGRYMGWSPPLDYEPVNELLKELGVGPYTGAGDISWTGLTHGYWKESLITLIVFLTTAAIAWWVSISNRRLKSITSELVKSQNSLEETVSERMAALNKTQLRLQTLFDATAELIILVDLEDRITQANPYVFERTGYSEKEVIGHDIREFFSQRSRDLCDDNFPIPHARGFIRADVEFVCKDGSLLQMEFSATAVPDEAGNVTTFLIIQRDMTEHNRAAVAMADSERRFRAIFNSTYQFIGLLDPQGTLLEANQTALDFIGLTNSDVVGTPFWETPWWTHSPQLQKRLKEGIGEAARGKLVRFEAIHIGKEGQKSVIDFSLKPVFNDKDEAMLIIPEGRDITELTQAEDDLRRHQQEMAHVMRLSTMGEMASGIAHELNQPLTALLSYCGSAEALAKSLPAPSQQLSSILERATEQAHRAGEIIRHLRGFVGKEIDDKQPMNIDEVIRALNVLLSSELKSTNVTLENDLDCRGCMVKANTVQIEQVLVNLVRNSFEAIKNMSTNGGVVSLKTRVAGNEFVEVTVADTGPGIEPGMTEKLFNPFETSKTSGLGMGLPISRTIIEAHGGKLWVDKDYENGALFGFKLPISK
jgi:PAS domain S-box-containing protein